MSNTLKGMRVLGSIEGSTNRFNQVIYHEPNQRSNNNNIVCYFGGDVQDLSEIMTQNKDNIKFLDYSLENMCQLLSSKFRNSHIFAIRANRFHDKTFAVYENFVTSDAFGCPKHEFNKQSLTHLRNLLINSFNKLNINIDFNKDESLVLIGFSKGCVVLNQFLYSFYVSSDDPELQSLNQRILRMYWVDGGHSGGSNTWITSSDVLKYFSKMNINVFIHVTPYQVMCRYRPWIAKEEQKFHNLLTELGVKTERIVHFSDEEKSLEMHFKVLKSF